VPPERVYLQLLDEPKTSKIVVVRDLGSAGGIHRIENHLYIDGKRAADLEPGERLDLAMAPGAYVLGILPTYWSGDGEMYTIETTLRAGVTSYYRIMQVSPGPLKIQPFSIGE